MHSLTHLLDDMLGVEISEHLISKVGLKLSSKRITCTKVLRALLGKRVRLCASMCKFMHACV